MTLIYGGVAIFAVVFRSQPAVGELNLRKGHFQLLKNSKTVVY